ncbi:Ldh family oxidoreductase [Aneurinibacillus tyrosinisolvens]|uniref:Ldh family oxidoreductase n=1 Tax=Aneurinibacillus tyrosinisolvens TaxID=1443435 RepID=UPI00063F9521|nr:Ldh family oxidoreductase [Aneurinibacillus tyrosinisolvens]
MMQPIYVPVDSLKEHCRQILRKASLPLEEAEAVADNLVDANLTGVDSHGVTRLADYLTRLENGVINNKTNLTVIRERETTALYDANNGWGQYAGKIAMEKAIEKAKKYGSAFVGVNNSNHFGTAAYFARMAAQADCLGIVQTNASPLMVAWGSKKPTLGTNPIAVSVPTHRHPVTLDMATSNVARGKINLAVKNKAAIPEGWAITVDGEPTTDAEEALKGFLLPFGAKGSGLAMMIDIMSGVMTNALFGEDVPRMYDDPAPQQLGHLFIVFDISSFMDVQQFKDRMDQRVKQTVESPAAPGYDRVYMPGEIEQLKRERCAAEGVPLSRAIYEELQRLGKKYGVETEDFAISLT